MIIYERLFICSIVNRFTLSKGRVLFTLQFLLELRNDDLY